MQMRSVWYVAFARWRTVMLWPRENGSAPLAIAGRGVPVRIGVPRQQVPPLGRLPRVSGRRDVLAHEPHLERDELVRLFTRDLVVIFEHLAHAVEVRLETRLADAAMEVAPDLVHAKAVLRLNVEARLLLSQWIEMTAALGYAFPDPPAVVARRRGREHAPALKQPRVDDDRGHPLRSRLGLEPLRHGAVLDQDLTAATEDQHEHR